jgi:hypothetical protein
MGKNESALRSAFEHSRTGAILKCAGILVDSGRKDLAREVLKTTSIDRAQLARLKNGLSGGQADGV